MSTKFGVLSIILTILILGASIIETNLTLKNNAPTIVSAGGNKLLRYSYLPRTSLIRTASSWYDRVVELYEKQNDEYILKNCQVYEYIYPIFKGELEVLVKPCKK